MRFVEITMLALAAAGLALYGTDEYQRSVEKIDARYYMGVPLASDISSLRRDIRRRHDPRVGDQRR